MHTSRTYRNAEGRIFFDTEETKSRKKKTFVYDIFLLSQKILPYSQGNITLILRSPNMI